MKIFKVNVFIHANLAPHKLRIINIFDMHYRETCFDFGFYTEIRIFICVWKYSFTENNQKGSSQYHLRLFKKLEE